MVVLRLAIPAVLLWVISRQVDVQEVWRLASGANMWGLALSSLVMILRLPMAGARWQLLLQRRGYRFSTGELTTVIFQSHFAATFLPGAAATDVVRGLILHRRRVDARDLVETMLAERFAGVLSLIALSCPPAIWVLWSQPTLATVGLAVLALALGVLVSMVCAPMLASVADGPSPGKIRTLLAAFGRLQADRPLMLRLMVFSVGFQLAAVVAVYLIGVAVGAPIGIVYYFLFLPLIWLWMTLPISISGIGVREAAFVFYFGLIGMDPDTALTISALMFAQGLAIALLAGLHLGMLSPRAA
jgi:uncharacterized membrane protein YbhN (UPF0104 family)